MTVDSGMPLRVVVQQRQRFLRDGLHRLLNRHPDIDVVGTVAVAVDLIDLCEARGPDVVLLEMDLREGDPSRLTSRLRRHSPGLRLIGMDGLDGGRLPARPWQPDLQAVIARGAGARPIVEAIRNTGAATRTRGVYSLYGQGAKRDSRRLTAREMTVLAMVAGGWTSRAMSSELQISVKTVENHKQKVFAKLEVQNQAHAVSVAMRQGILAPERVVEFPAS